MNVGSRDFWQERYRAATADGVTLWGSAPNGWIAEQTAGLSAGLAIDVGAGEGRNALWLADRGWRVVATDFASAAVAGLQRAADARGLAVTAIEADATAWTSPEPATLAILCYLQLEPAALAAAVAAAGASLAPGGTLLGIWHDRADVERGLGGTMSPAIRTTAAETAAAAELAGLRVTLSSTRDRAVPGGLACDVLLTAVAPGRGLPSGITGL